MLSSPHVLSLITPAFMVAMDMLCHCATVWFAEARKSFSSCSTSKVYLPTEGSSGRQTGGLARATESWPRRHVSAGMTA